MAKIAELQKETNKITSSAQNTHHNHKLNKAKKGYFSDNRTNTLDAKVGLPSIPLIPKSLHVVASKGLKQQSKPDKKPTFNKIMNQHVKIPTLVDVNDIYAVGFSMNK